MIRIGLFLILAGLPGVAQAEDAPQRIVLAVGETVAIDVGTLRGMICDDIAILSAEMRAKSETTNSFVVTGLKPGTTLCGVGTEPQRGKRMFQVHIVEAKPAPRPPRPSR